MNPKKHCEACGDELQAHLSCNGCGGMYEDTTANQKLERQFTQLTIAVELLSEVLALECNFPNYPGHRGGRRDYRERTYMFETLVAVRNTIEYIKEEIGNDKIQRLKGDSLQAYYRIPRP